MNLKEKIDNWDTEKSAAVFGTRENDWVPTERYGLMEGISCCALEKLDTETLTKIYKLMGRNKEPEDIVDRIHAGLEESITWGEAGFNDEFHEGTL